ncbi:hypothetical protein G9A89_014148 [Geosiphon pyriformis]|nr:hypothetical protein G9A89_014148 [Geosiphon pyriformis]
MAEANIKEYIPTIKEILLDSDLKAITAKAVRVKLEEKYKVDLTSRKAEVQKLIEECFDEMDFGEDGEDYEEEEEEDMKPEYTIQDNKNETSKKTLKNTSKSPKKAVKPKDRHPKSKSTIVNQSDYSSPEDENPSQAKKKRGRKRKSANKGADASDATGEETNRKSKSKNGDTPKKKKSTTKRKKTEEIDDDDEAGKAPPKKRKGNTGIHKPLLLSPVLSGFLGENELSRLEVVKRLWTYIKDNNLQDPKDKRFIVCDEKLIEIFGKDRMHSFTMNKYLTAHLRKKEDVLGGSDFAQTGDLDQGHSSGQGEDHEEEQEIHEYEHENHDSEQKSHDEQQENYDDEHEDHGEDNQDHDEEQADHGEDQQDHDDEQEKHSEEVDEELEEFVGDEDDSPIKMEEESGDSPDKQDEEYEEEDSNKNDSGED